MQGNFGGFGVCCHRGQGEWHSRQESPYHSWIRIAPRSLTLPCCKGWTGMWRIFSPLLPMLRFISSVWRIANGYDKLFPLSSSSSSSSSPLLVLLVSAGIIFASVCVASGCLSLESYDSFAVGCFSGLGFFWVVLPFYSIQDVFVLKWVAFQRILHHYNRGKEGRSSGK